MVGKVESQQQPCEIMIDRVDSKVLGVIWQKGIANWRKWGLSGVISGICKQESVD